MKQSINLYQFRQAFADMDRKENFSYEGLGALLDYLEDLETCCQDEMELDVIALCCEFTEYANLAEYNQNYDYVESIDQVRELTQVIIVGTESFIIQDY